MLLVLVCSAPFEGGVDRLHHEMAGTGRIRPVRGMRHQAWGDWVSATIHTLLERDVAEQTSTEDFAVLYRRYWPRLVRLVVRRTGDTSLAEDIAQETLARALHNFQALDTGYP